jgi:pyruvate dehydrogenase phosphatase
MPRRQAQPEHQNTSQLTHHAANRFVILATDGLWDYLSHTEAVSIVSHAIAAGWSQEAAAKRLVERALELAANESDMTMAQLLQLPAGRQRRGRHDDTTAVVMYF